MSESPNTLTADTQDNGGSKPMLNTEPLKAVDRCDRCSGQAFVRAVLKSGGVLLFCAHHAREHSAKLHEACDHIHDETDRLRAEESQPRDAGSTI